MAIIASLRRIILCDASYVNPITFLLFSCLLKMLHCLGSRTSGKPLDPFTLSTQSTTKSSLGLQTISARFKLVPRPASQAQTQTKMDDDAIEVAEASHNIKALMDGLDAVKDDPDETVAESILDAVLRMSSDIKSPEVLSALSARIDTLAACLETFIKEAVVVEVLFAVLNKLDLGSFGSASGNVKRVLQAMEIHSVGEETLVEYGCLVIAKVAAEEEGRKNCIDQDAMAMLDMAERIITNERNKKNVTQARKMLS